MTDCRSIAFTTSESDIYVAKLSELESRTRKRRRWYVPRLSSQSSTAEADEVATNCGTTDSD
jgi:hypothetical protein